MSIDPSKVENNFYKNEGERQKAYARRNDLVLHAVSLARKSGYKAGFMLHTPMEDITSGRWGPEWCIVACIELPTGQITWHMDSRGLVYDGHSDSTKWTRIRVYTL